MKTSSVLASLLFGSFAVAAPLHKRKLVYTTETVIETCIITTTVFGDEPTASPTSVAITTSSAGEFYQQPKPAVTSSAVVEAAPSSAPAPPAAPISSAAPAYTPVKPSSVYTPPVETPTSTSTPTPTPTPAPAPAPQTSSAAPVPAPSSEAHAPPAYTPAPAPAPTPTPAPAPSTSYGTGMSSGQSFSDVDITVYDNTGAAGACGENLTDDMMVVAIAQPAWSAMGGSTYNVMTGAASNPWCGKKVEINYNGASAKATILDLCPGCHGQYDIDLSRGVWKALGINEDTRLKASWTLL